MVRRNHGLFSVSAMGAVLCIWLPGSSGSAQAQTFSPSDSGANARSTGGWKVVRQAANGALAEPMGEQRVYYQAQGGLSDLPQLPSSLGGAASGGGNNMPALPSGLDSMSYGQAAGAGLPVLPSGLPQGAGSPGSNAPRASELPRGLPAANLLPVGRPADAANRQPTLGGPSAFSGQQPSADYRSTAQAPAPASTVPNGRAGQTAGQQVGFPREVAGRGAPPQDASSPLRPIQDSGQLPPSTGASGTRLPPQAIATGYPFVSPAPRRVGNFSTSPYNPALFQFAAYQRGAPINAPPQAPSGQFVSGQLAAATNTAPSLTAAQPQFQNPGIYPTAAYQCAPNPSFPSAGIGPGTYAPPTLTPNLTPGLYSSNNSGYAPVFSLGQENYNVLLGRGIIGQPTVYVPGQPMRNFLRYLSP